jgi:hypothetical protein
MAPCGLAFGDFDVNGKERSRKAGTETPALLFRDRVLFALAEIASNERHNERY